MLEQKEIERLDDFFLELGDRKEKGVYSYRINGYNEQILTFIQKYYEAARTSGIVIEGKIPNPDRQNLSYYEEMMGLDFQRNLTFISSSLKKWLPRMNDYQRKTVAESLYDFLESLYQAGKTEAMIRNAYIKFMCWLYYKFERILNQLGENKIPKILYEGTISNYELMLISILSHAGCDVIFLQYQGDNEYKKIDKEFKLSKNLSMPALEAFPKDFNLRWLRERIRNQQNLERLYGKRPKIQGCTNVWTEKKGFEDIKIDGSKRGEASDKFYNCFYKINGVNDKQTYLEELYQFQLEIKNSGRNLVILEEKIPQPSVDEIAFIQRKQYSTREEALQDLSNNITFANRDLQLMIKQAFLDIMLQEKEQNINRLVNKAVYLLCWIKRYQSGLFSNWKMPKISCFIYLGTCNNEQEAMFLYFLAKLPVDILILNPDKKTNYPLLHICEIDYPDSLKVDKYPRNAEIQMGTAAYYAERELDSIMYQDSGMFRNQQFHKAVTITLKTMYEEIEILWDQELKYRANFSIVNNMVNLPVIFAKVSGVKDTITAYWEGIKKLLTEDTLLIKKAPYINSTDANPMKGYTLEFFKNGKLLKKKIKEHKNYQYKVLREEMQDYILEKLQLLIDQKVIKGTFVNGTEYTIVATILNMPRDIIRMIQRFDFTKKNPKMVYINTTETMISLEDTIITAFLNLIGFDIVFFIPTGYQTIEQFFQKKLMEEHQIGDYRYDLQIPNFTVNSGHGKSTWRDKLFRRGR